MVRFYSFSCALAVLGLFPHLACGQISDSCAADSVFNPLITYGSVNDQEGNTYQTIVIGSQEWMAENLKVSRYRNGTPILHLPSTNWTTTGSGAWCWYGNDSASHHCPYGKLYNWYAVQDSRRICPVGWHIPTDQEWTLLENSLGGYEQAGGKMKSKGLSYWNSPNQDASNSSGFSGLPGGFRYGISGIDPFDFKGKLGYWWSATLGTSAGVAMFRGLLHDASSTLNTNFIFRCGMSVRCVNDQPVTGTKPVVYSFSARIFPNPAHDFVQVYINDGKEEMPFRILRTDGKEVLYGILQPGNSTIPLLGMVKGLYFVQIGDKGNPPLKLQIQ